MGSNPIANGALFLQMTASVCIYSHSTLYPDSEYTDGNHRIRPNNPAAMLNCCWDFGNELGCGPGSGNPCVQVKSTYSNVSLFFKSTDHTEGHLAGALGQIHPQRCLRIFRVFPPRRKNVSRRAVEKGIQKAHTAILLKDRARGNT